MAHSGRAQPSRTLKISPRVPPEEVPRGRPGDWLLREDGKYENRAYRLLLHLYV